MRITGLGTAPQILPSSAVSTIASTIQQQEGYIAPNAQYPNGSLAYQNNNPGNLRFAGQAGATQGVGGFAAFPSYQAGLDALNNQIQIYAGEGMTIQQMMNTYAPASDGNNPNAYANTIASALGVDPGTPLTALATGATDSGTTDDSVDSAEIDTAGISSIDFTDPATLAIIAGTIGLAFLVFRQ